MATAPGIPTPTDRVMRHVVQQVRLFMRDFPQLNRLVAGVEHGDRFVAWAIQDAIDDWNITPPLLSYISVASHPAPSLLIRKAASCLLEQSMILQARNHLSYSDGQGATVNSSDKAPSYQAIIGLLLSRYESSKLNMKVALNIENGWGTGVNSELRLIGAFYGL